MKFFSDYMLKYAMQKMRIVLSMLLALRLSIMRNLSSANHL